MFDEYLSDYLKEKYDGNVFSVAKVDGDYEGDLTIKTILKEASLISDIYFNKNDCDVSELDRRTEELFDWFSESCGNTRSSHDIFLMPAGFFDGLSIYNLDDKFSEYRDSNDGKFVDKRSIEVLYDGTWKILDY